MNNKNLLPYTRKALLLSVLFLMVLMSCKKDGELFPEFNNENLTINFTDTLNIVTTLLKEDSIRTDIAGANLLGIYNDSVFGPASASFYTEITLAGSNVYFGDNAVIDSVVLSMKYVGETSLYGSIVAPMNIDVYRLSEQLSQSEYYSNAVLNYNTTPLGSLSFLPNLTDSLQVIQNGVTTMQSAHIRIPLSNTFGQEILDAGKDANVIADNTALKTLVNGLYITPSTNVTNTTLAQNEGSILYLDMNSSLSTLTVFYSNDTGPEKSYSFIINSESKKFNHFEHNYTGTEIGKQLTNIAYDSTLTYVQSMGGVKTKLMIPNLKNLASDGKIIVNKAEIIFPVSEIGNNLAAIPTLALTGINSDNEATFLIDYFENAEYFGGTYNSTTKTYTFNIARHVQDLINNNTEDYGMYLIATGSSVQANRSVLNSFKHPSNKIKLNITYSKF